MNVRVLTDVLAIDREFTYTVPEGWADDPRFGVGTMVRVVLHGRRVGGWITEVGVEAPEEVELTPLAKLSSVGPGRELMDLSEWAAWRWAGRRAHFLRTASPQRVVAGLPRPQRSRMVPSGDYADHFEGEGRTLRQGPSDDPLPIALAAASRGQALILVPDHGRADDLARRLGREGAWAVRYPDGWDAAAAGATVVGTLSAAWAPAPDLAAVLVVDEHDESYRSESAPTWSGRDVAVERARRAGVPCVLLSPVPSLEALRSRPVMRPSRGTERDSWPQVEVVDRRGEDPGRAGLYSPELVRALRDGGRAACVLNRRGRALLLACHLCGELAVCTECNAPMRQTEDKQLRCRAGDHVRPLVCAECGSTKMRNLRAGVKRVREEIEALIRTPVAEATGSGYDGPPTARVVVGTEAVLHLGRPFDTVAFLEFDQELLAPRFRAREQALALIARAARITGPRDAGGKIVLQTRLPDDPAVTAALQADPAQLARAERDRRQELGLPPYGAIAVVSGPVAGDYMERFGTPLGVQIAPDPSGQYFLRAPDYDTLCDALASAERPSGRLRIDVDPIRAI
ncbi:hypothetical protein [Candidatus Poriferisocius sp.]|uniref:primosomal protein N' family DNA-binding protein n=1 Tax=Candidatus Poriferisocius sp. TaxID=3101276 RepID=UPI003B02A68C